MNKSNLLHFAVAACSYSLGALANDTNEIILQLTPAGEFRADDGRPEKISSWRIDAATAQNVISRFNARKQPVVIDYEHQTLHKEENGQPAPAAAWIRELMWKEGEGLFARAELTSKAKSAIENKEYLYFSPVFAYNAKTGHVTEIQMGAITNTPAVHGMNALELRAAATFGYQTSTEDTSMKKSLLACVISALALAPTTTEEEASVALSAHFEKDPLKKLREALGAEANANEEALVAACTTLKAKNPDPANYAPISVMNDLKEQVVALTDKLNARDQKDIDDSITAALADGRLLPAQESWARDLGKTNVAALTAFLNTASSIAALTQSQTKGQPPAGTNDDELTEEEIAVCTNMGISREDFKKSKAATKA